MYISIEKIKEELMAGKVRIAKFTNPIEGFRDMLYLIELLEPEKFTPQLKLGEVYVPSSIFAVRCLEIPKEARDVSPSTDVIPQSTVCKNIVIDIEHMTQFIIQCAKNPKATVEENFIFPDEEEEVMIEKGNEIFKDFELYTGIKRNVEFNPSEYEIKNMEQFFELIFVEVYNTLIKDNDFPIDQIIDIEFKVDKKKDYIPKFYMYYKRNISCGDDVPYMDILAKGLKELTREPKDFTLISATMTNRYKSEYIEFLMEIYTKIKFVYLINNLYNKMQNLIKTIESNYQKFI